jgi:predicted metallo-beta-lactamase superfamily hydrolase
MNAEEYLKKGNFKNIIKTGRISVMPVWFDSMGVKSMCTYIETPEIKIIIDPGYAIMQHSYPLDEDEKLSFLKTAEERVREYTKKADIVIITHFHYDHHKRPSEFSESYIDKITYMKNPNEWINYSQWKRARIIYQDLMNLFGNVFKIDDFMEEPVEKNYEDPYNKLHLAKKRDFGDYTKRHEELLKTWKDNMYKSVEGWMQKKWLTELKVARTSINFIRKREINFGKTSIWFPGTLFHGLEYAKTGWLEPVVIKRDDKVVLYSSDIMGPNIEDYADWIIKGNPNVIILDGPSTYLLGYMFNQINLDRCIENASKIVKETDFDIMIYDHHLLRERNFRKHMGDFYDTVLETGKVVITAAEWFDLPPLVDVT